MKTYNIMLILIVVLLVGCTKTIYSDKITKEIMGKFKGLRAMKYRKGDIHILTQEAIIMALEYKRKPTQYEKHLDIHRV